ncbi:aspartate/glutamate racemase family protein [Mangrovibacterium marinum]|uniref:aspartate/glutamate racemase family protein n=1 Tax=Mangrovibacterium marinum TaxID=1639118 RepID=UPI0038B29E2B
MVVPDEKQIEIINQRLFNELELGIFKEATRLEILEIINKLKRQYEVDSVILGCTEFPLMFTEDNYLELPFLNTTKIHVDAIIKTCLNGN